MNLGSKKVSKSIALDGYLCPKIVDAKRNLGAPILWESIGSDTKKSSRESTVHLNGNIARRALPASTKEYSLWDDELAGFGLRIRPSGRRTWFVRLRLRGKHKRESLGCTKTVDATTARANARKLLSAAALDGLPKRPVVRENPSLASLFEAHWDDLSRVWKASTEKRNRAAWRIELAPVFGRIGIADITRADVVRWRDDCAGGK